MFTREIWWNFEFNLKRKDFYSGGYMYSDEKVCGWLLGTILGTPFTIVLDIITLPIQIIYYICLKKIKKLRK